MVEASTSPPVIHSFDLYKFDDTIVFHLPGFGDKLDTCGEPVFLGHYEIENIIHYVKHVRSCHRFECPICWKSWKSRAVNDIMRRLEAYTSLTSRRLVHYVISPPQAIKYDTVSSYKALKKQAYKIAKKRGIKGGVMIFHQRAIRYSDPKEYERYHCSAGPHFHIIGDGWLKNVSELFLKDGWIVKNLRMRDFSGIFRTLHYILEHSSRGYPAISQTSDPLKVRISAITWFGSMSYNRLHIPKFVRSDKIYCPICDCDIEKAEWYILEWFDLLNPPPDVGSVVEDRKNGFSVVRSLTCWSGQYVR